MCSAYASKYEIFLVISDHNVVLNSLARQAGLTTKQAGLTTKLPCEGGL